MSIKVNETAENGYLSKLKGFTTNPFINCIFPKNTKNKTEQMTVKEQLYQNAANLPNDVREKFLEYLEKGITGRKFIDMLNERYEKKKEAFEIAWAEYQEAKNNLKLLEKIYEIIEAKYANSESNFDQGKVNTAYKEYHDYELSTDNLLKKCRDIAT